MIDRAFTRAEARYIPNGAGSTADMAHPTRTGDLVVFAYPPYQFDAETPGTLVAASPFLRPARLRAGRPGPRQQHQHARDLPGRRQGHRQGPGRRAARSTSRRPWRSCWASPSRSTARARSSLTWSRAATATSRSRSSGSTTSTASSARRRIDDRRHQPSRSAGPPSWRRCSTRTSRRSPDPG